MRLLQPGGLNAHEPSVKELRGDRQIQCDVLVALAECRNHKKWFASFAPPVRDGPSGRHAALVMVSVQRMPRQPRFGAALLPRARREGFLAYASGPGFMAPSP